MKELSIEEKARRYDEAIKEAFIAHKDEDKHLKATLERIFSELRESEDEKIRKEIIEFVKSRLAGFPQCDKYLAWLEKHKTSDEALQYLKENHSPSEMSDFQAAMNIAVVKAFDAGKKQGEQKSVNKAEPKFHEGEWITNGDYTWKIIEVKPLDYILQSQDGNVVDDTISHVDGQFHSFTIEDAKDGDVFADGNLPFIFKKIDNNKYSYAYCGISVDDGFKIKSDGGSGEWTRMQDIKPATKEQRDLLFSKMKEAGYKWDAEKKELKKIESNPTNWLQVLEDKLPNATPKQLAVVLLKLMIHKQL